MRLPSGFAIALASAAALTIGATLPAQAACKRMGFLVNDYGKDGPTKDAQELLEKDIAKWAAGQGIKTYTVNKKDVSCELFLNFIVFDEHTCTASATVCWDEKAPAAKPATAQEAKATGTAAPAVEKAATEQPAAAAPVAVEIKTEAKADAPAEAKPEVKKGAAKPAATETPAAAAKKADKVETGAVQSKPQDAKPADAVAPAATGQAAVAAPAMEKAKATPDQDPSQIAAAAAERAAAAAERAAVAAERAAQAAMDAQSGNNQTAATPASATAATPAATAAAPAVVQPITPLPAGTKP